MIRKPHNFFTNGLVPRFIAYLKEVKNSGAFPYCISLESIITEVYTTLEGLSV